MSEYCLKRRLSSAASLVRAGARLADIGTDHAYLPIALLQCGRIESAVCSDVNPGPLMRARENVSRASLEGSVELVLTSGALALAGKGITDYAICGMGGELIASIIEEAPHLKDEALRLILQPMSKVELLRKYLWESGFKIDREVYSEDDGKYYVCFLARYTSVPEEYSDEELYFGKALAFALATPEGRGYAMARLSSLRRAAEGKLAGGEQDSPEARIIKKTEKLLLER